MPTIADLLKRAYAHWDDAAVLAPIGRELHDRNRLADSRAVLERALALNADDPRSWAYRAFTHLRDYDVQRGLEILREGIQKTDSDRLRSTHAAFSSDDEEKRAIQARLAQSTNPEVQAELQWNRVWQGDDRAIDDLRELATKHADNPRVRDIQLWMLLDAASKKMPGVNLKEEGIPLASAKIEEDPERVSGHWMKAQMQSVAEDWDGLLETTARALEHFPDEETIMFLRGRAFHEKGDLDRAMQCFARAIGMKPSFAGARVELGKCYEAKDAPDLAEEIFREIPKANPRFAGGPISLALFLGRRGRWEEAESLFVETWGKLPEWARRRVRANPAAKPLLDRPAVQAAI